MIHIYYSYLSEENHKSLLQRYLCRFSNQYQTKIRSYIRWQDTQLSLLGRILLYKGIEDIKSLDYNDIEIRYTKFNKPYFKNNIMNFNISHSGEIVVCVLSDSYEVGIDIEIVTDINVDDFKTQMTKREWERICISANKKEAFFDYWTQKEAVMKAHGHGLSIPLNSFEIMDNSTQINEEKFYLKEIQIDQNYKCYVSLNEKMNDISIKNDINLIN